MSKLDSALALIACIIQWGKQTNQIIQEYRLRCSEFHCQVLGLYKRLLVVPQYFVFLIFHSSWNCSYSYTTLNEANICQLFFFPVKVDMQLSSDQQDKCEHIMWQFLAIFPRTTWWVSFVPSVCPLLLSWLECGCWSELYLGLTEWRTPRRNSAKDWRTGEGLKL